MGLIERLLGNESPVPLGNWRSVGTSFNGFFHECFLDELAAAEQRALTAEQEAAAMREQMAAIEIKLWNHPLLFVLFIAALTLEWILRRRAGLA